MKIAIAQGVPAVLNLSEGVTRAVQWIDRAGEAGVSILAFGESFIGGYPVWVDWPGFSDFKSSANAAVHARLLNACIRLESKEVDELCAACKRANLTVVIGANLLSESGKSVYNALLVIDSNGMLRQVRRKLVPTHGERLAWAPAADREHADVRSIDLTDGSRLGGLMCWEHWMPLARDRMHVTGETVHVAAWPHCSDLHHLCSRHYAFEGACFVLATALYLPRDAMPDLGIAVPDSFTGLHGGSAIIAPDTSFIVEPVCDREELLVAEIDPEDANRAAFLLDTGGHYRRAELG